MDSIHSANNRRISSLFVYFFATFINGFNFYSRNCQSIFYLRELNASEIPMYQGVLISTNLAVGAFSGLLLGYTCDRLGNARRCVIIGNTLNFIGVIIYSVPIAPPVLIVGQLLNGWSFGIMTVGVAELARMYDGFVLTRVLSLVNCGMALGFIIGPLMNFALVNVDIQWGWFYIHPTNAPGYIVGILCIGLNLATILFLFNSDEVNKYQTEERGTEESLLISKSEKIKTKFEDENGGHNAKKPIVDINIIDKLRLLLTDSNLLLLYFATFFWTFLLICMEAFIPLVAANWLKYNNLKLSISYVLSGVVFAIANFSFAFLQKHLTDFYSVVILSIIQLVIPVLIWLMHYMNGTGRSLPVYYYCWVGFGSLTWILEDVLSRSVCSRFVPLEMQGFSEGVRAVPKSMGMITAGFFTAAWYNSINLISPIIITISISLIIGLIAKRKSFIDPKRLPMPSKIMLLNKTTTTQFSTC